MAQTVTTMSTQSDKLAEAAPQRNDSSFVTLQLFVFDHTQTKRLNSCRSLCQSKVRRAEQLPRPPSLSRPKSPLEAAEELRKKLRTEAEEEEEEERRNDALRHHDEDNLIRRISDLDLHSHPPIQVNQQNGRTDSPSPALAITRGPLRPSPLKRRNKPKPLRNLTTTMNSRPVRLLLASLGNPPPYHSTRHSAAHILLKSFASHLKIPSPQKDKAWSGAVSLGADFGRPEYTIWQSVAQMNISGLGLLKAWKYFLSQQTSQSGDAVTALVVLHDELESPPGQLKIRRGEGSAKGHNGIKSVQASLQGAGLLKALSEDGRFIKIGIGIGRPVSRERDDVSAFVLGQVTRAERDGIEGATGSLERMLEGECARLSKL